MKEELKNHLRDILQDKAVIPDELALEGYTTALLQWFDSKITTNKHACSLLRIDDVNNNSCAENH